MTELPEDPTLAVKCPACGSPPGEPCIRWAHNEQLPRFTPHAERMTAARKATK